MKTPVKKEQLRVIHTLLPPGLKSDLEAKAEFVVGFTGSEDLQSTTQLTFDQANQMIASLGGRIYLYDHWAIFNPTNAQHKYILSLLLQMGWSNYEVNLGRNVADMRHLSEFLQSEKSPVKKRLKDMSVHETTKLISALENILKSNLKKV